MWYPAFACCGWLCLCLLAACGGPPPDAGTTIQVAGPPSLEDAGRATYDGILDEPVTLDRGAWRGAPFVEGGASRPVVKLLSRISATGDVNGDGWDDAVVLLTESSGGSGQNLFLAVLSVSADGTTNATTALVGDRVRVVTLSAGDGRIRLHVVEHGPDDPMCCPTQKATRDWALREGELVQVGGTVEGLVSLDDLTGTEWRLTHLGTGQEAPVDPPVTLRFETDRAGGGAGCNNYFTAFTESSPRVISAGPVGATRRMCEAPAMSVEDAFLQRLELVSGYDFVAGDLALSYELDGQQDHLLFRREE